jgi:hypothetical protein
MVGVGDVQADKSKAYHNHYGCYDERYGEQHVAEHPPRLHPEYQLHSFLCRMFPCLYRNILPGHFQP